MRRTAYKPGVDANQFPCSILLERQAEINEKQGRMVGLIELYDTGLTLRCNQKKAFAILRREGCSLGANVVNLVQERTMDFVSSCYQVKAEFWQIHDLNQLDQKSKAVYLK